MTLLNTPEIRRIESRFISLLERTFFKAVIGKPAPSFPKTVKTQFSSKTFEVQLDKIIDDIYQHSIKYTDKQSKKAQASVTKQSSKVISAADSTPLPITEEAVKQAAGLSTEITESIIRILKDEGIYQEHPDKLERRIRDLWGGEKYKAKRFARTFTADVSTNTSLWRYQDAGIEELQFYAKIDEKTSDQCRTLHGTIFSTNSKEAFLYRPPLHQNCRSDLLPIPVTMKVDPSMRVENRDFSTQMDQDFNFLEDKVDKKIIQKTFSEIDTFNEKYRIDQFILDEDIEARLQKLNIQVLSELPKETSLKTKKSLQKTVDMKSSAEVKIQGIEKEIRGRKTEKAYVFDKNGNVIFSQEGEKDFVKFKSLKQDSRYFSGGRNVSS